MKPAKDTYRQKLLDPRWQKKRLQVLERDNWTCRMCGATEKTLHVHHVHYSKMSEGPWDYEDSSLVTLCGDCHELESEELKWAMPFLIGNIAEAGIWNAGLMALLADAFATPYPMSSEEAHWFVTEVMKISQRRNQSMKAKNGTD